MDPNLMVAELSLADQVQVVINEVISMVQPVDNSLK